MSNYFEKINWASLLHRALITIFSFYLAFYTFLDNILTQKEINSYFSQLHQFLFVSYLLSIVILAIYVSQIISKRFLAQLSISYILYLIVSYFLLVTRNLNNEKFKLWNLTKNHFWENNGLVTLISILVLATIIKLVMTRTNYLSKLSIFLEDNHAYHLPLSFLIGNVAILDSKLMVFFREQIDKVLPTGDVSVMLATLFKVLFVSLIAFTVITYVAVDGSEKMRKNQPSLSIAVTTSLLLALIFNYTLQLGVKTDVGLLGRYIFPGATLYQISILALLFMFAYVVVNRYISTTLILIILGTLVSVANVLKESMRSEPLLITDFVWLREVNLLLSFLNPTMIFYIVLVFLLPVAIYLIFRHRFLADKVIIRKRVRLPLVVLLLTIFSTVFTVFKAEKDGKVVANLPVVSTVNNWVDITWMGFSKNASYKSLMYVWTKQLTKSVMDTPKEYSEEKIKEIARRYESEAKTINRSRNGRLEDQTVIFVLSESFADPSRLQGISLSQNIIPYISNVKKNYTSGLMISDFYGGGTANMETQSLTGLPYSNLSSSVSVMNTEVLPKMAYIPSISSSYQNNKKIAIHLHDAANYSRNIVYKDLKFNKFIALDGTKDKPTQLEFLSAGARDKSTYYAVTSNLTKNTGQFFSVITMQNHVPWKLDSPANITASGTGLTESETKSLTSYARLLSVTDSATADFLNELSKYDKKITVVFYGDHLPGLYPASTFTSDSESQFETDYFVWSNYNTKKLDYSKVKSSDFPALVLKQTNSKVSPYYALLTKVLDEKNHSKTDKSIVSEDLKLIQYDLILGKGYILKNNKFFKVQE